MLSVIQRLAGWPIAAKLLASAVLILAAYLFQMPFEAKEMGGPFFLFLWAVCLSALAFGSASGWLAVALSTALSTHFFEPIGSFAVNNAADFIEIQLYAVAAVVSVRFFNGIRGILLLQANANKALNSEVRNNDLLLKEFAHRAANDFASIDALIRQRASVTGDRNVRIGLEQASGLVHAVARISLHLGDLGSKTVDSAKKLELLCDDLDAILPSRIKLIRSLESHDLPSEELVTVGLFINELVTNSFKYAFPEGRSGTVRVAFLQEGHCLALVVEDDGVGMADQIKGHGTGLALIHALASGRNWQVSVHSGEQGRNTKVLIPCEVSTQEVAAVR